MLIGEAEKVGASVIAKAAAFVSDESAAAAKARLLKMFPLGQPLAVLPGAPLPPQVIADFAAIVGNKMQKGAVKFSQVVKEMSAEYGGAVKAHLDNLAEAYTAQMKRLGLKVDAEDLRITIKEWEVERAKNINEIIEVPRKSEIMGNGSIERAQLRDKIGQAEFASYDKHIKAKTPEEAKKLSLMGDKPAAQFLPNAKVKALYKEGIEQAMNNGLFFFDKNKQTYYFFHKFEKPIGYNLGKETNWIRVELSGGTIHGHPTTLQDVRGYFPELKGVK